MLQETLEEYKAACVELSIQDTRLPVYQGGAQQLSRLLQLEYEQIMGVEDEELQVQSDD